MALGGQVDDWQAR